MVCTRDRGAIASFLEKGIEIGVASCKVAIPSALKDED